MSIPDLVKQKALIKSMYLGLLMNVLAPMGITVIAIMVRGEGWQGSQTGDLLGQSNYQFLFWVMLFLSLAGFIAVHFIRRRIAFQPFDKNIELEQQFISRINTVSITVYGINLTHTVYGIILYAFGMSNEILMLFAAFTLIGYQFLRPRIGFINDVDNIMGESAVS